MNPLVLPFLALFITNVEPVEVSPIAMEAIARPSIDLQYEVSPIAVALPDVVVLEKGIPDSWVEASHRIKLHGSGELVFKSSRHPNKTFVLRRQELASGAQWELTTYADDGSSDPTVLKNQWGIVTTSNDQMVPSSFAQVRSIFGVSKSFQDIWNTLVPGNPLPAPKMTSAPSRFNTSLSHGMQVDYAGWNWSPSVGVDLPSEITYRNLLMGSERETQIKILVNDLRVPAETELGWPITTQD